MQRVSVLLLVLVAVVRAAQTMPFPFTRVLQTAQPALSGDDVYVAQNLLLRSPFVSGLTVTSTFDAATVAAVKAFKAGNNVTGPADTLDAAGATALLALHERDGYRDDATTARSMGLLYKIVLSCHANRSIEVIGRLLDADNNLLLKFPARLHGYRDDDQARTWPDYDTTGDFGVNELTGDGGTPTGLTYADLNTPEPDPASYGPYPINRFVTGIRGNSLFLLPRIRNGILLHTGQWPNWTTAQPMPNSAGCVHTHPTDALAIWNALTALGVVAHTNTGGALPYPYAPQGLFSVEQVD